MISPSGESVTVGRPHRRDSTDAPTNGEESLRGGLSACGWVYSSMFEESGHFRSVSAGRHRGAVDVESDRASNGRDLQAVQKSMDELENSWIGSTPSISGDTDDESGPV